MLRDDRCTEEGMNFDGHRLRRLSCKDSEGSGVTAVARVGGVRSQPGPTVVARWVVGPGSWTRQPWLGRGGVSREPRAVPASCLVARRPAALRSSHLTDAQTSLRHASRLWREVSSWSYHAIRKLGF